MAGLFKSSAESAGFSVVACSGDQCVLLAFNLEETATEKLAGFSVRRRLKGGDWVWLMNRLSFSSGYTAETTATERKWFSTDEAPYQKFWWVDFPPEDHAGTYEYEVSVKRFVADDTAELVSDQQIRLEIDCTPFQDGNLELAFTRGYLSSQAYADKFQNGRIAPVKKTIDFATSAYEEKYTWLGAHARVAISRFIEACAKSPGATLDVLVYDFDEPSIIKALVALRTRLRIVMDNASLHTRPTSLEPLARSKLMESAGDKNVKIGRFGRYQHNKVMIMRDGNGKAIRVLTGSTNFSINGLYVNANHVAVFDDPKVADYYSRAFENAFTNSADRTAFINDKNTMSKSEFFIDGPTDHKYVFSFAPHENGALGLNRVSQAITKADSSVLFAVMALKGKSDVLDQLRILHDGGKVFSYGVTDNLGEEGEAETKTETEDSDSEPGVTVYSPGKKGVLIKSAVLKRLVPKPFAEETKPGLAHLIHHKFVVVDFNGKNPVVFFGSSNFANGGEENNGDNLIAVYDAEVATVFAIEAIRLVDHYAFREVIAKATKQTPLRLRFNRERWWVRYYDDGSLKQRERELFSALPQ